MPNLKKRGYSTGTFTPVPHYRLNRAQYARRLGIPPLSLKYSDNFPAGSDHNTTYVWPARESMEIEFLWKLKQLALVTQRQNIDKRVQNPKLSNEIAVSDKKRDIQKVPSATVGVPEERKKNGESDDCPGTKAITEEQKPESVPTDVTDVKVIVEDDVKVDETKEPGPDGRNNTKEENKRKFNSEALKSQVTAYLNDIFAEAILEVKKAALISSNEKGESHMTTIVPEAIMLDADVKPGPNGRGDAAEGIIKSESDVTGFQKLEAISSTDVSESQKLEPIPSDVTEFQKLEPNPSDVTEYQELEATPSDVTEYQELKAISSTDVTEFQKLQPVPLTDVTEFQKLEPIPSEITEYQELEPTPSDVTEYQNLEPIPSDVTENQELEPTPSEITEYQELEPTPSTDVTEFQKLEPIPSTDGNVEIDELPSKDVYHKLDEVNVLVKKMPDEKSSRKMKKRVSRMLKTLSCVRKEDDDMAKKGKKIERRENKLDGKKHSILGHLSNGFAMCFKFRLNIAI